MLYMGVDLGGTGIKAGVVSENGEILSKGSTPTMKERPYQDIIRDIAALCEKVAGQANVTMDEIRRSAWVCRVSATPRRALFRFARTWDGTTYRSSQRCTNICPIGSSSIMTRRWRAMPNPSRA